MPKKSPPFEFVLMGLLVGAYFVWFAWPLIGAASENYRLVSAFVGDEAAYAGRAEQLLDLRTLHIDVQDQGHLYLYLALFPLLVLRNFTPVSQQSIVLALRMVSLASALAAVFVTFLIARSCFGRVIGWVSVLFLCFVPAFRPYATTARTDIPHVGVGSFLFRLSARADQEAVRTLSAPNRPAADHSRGPTCRIGGGMGAA